ncbi:MAG: heme-binding domain-containing protein [Bacteroidota bacterium]
MVKKLIVYVLAALLIVFIGMQFDRTVKNNSNDQTKHISTLYILPDSVEAILSTACYDCHSNNTRYPWYAEVQPIGRWLNDHIQQGKKELNFSEFASYRPRRQFHKLEEVVEMVKENSMPLPSYTIMHNDAVLNDGQKALLYSWVSATHDSMKLAFHPDSLKARRR